MRNMSVDVVMIWAEKFMGEVWKWRQKKNSQNKYKKTDIYVFKQLNTD